jgi:hypothetical protein
MNKKELSKAVTKYKATAAETEKDDMRDVLIADELSEADADQLLAALYPVEAEAPAADHFQEWEVKVGSGGKFEKLKVRRPVVKITQEEADTINAGVLSGGNTYARMYFKAE